MLRVIRLLGWLFILLGILLLVNGLSNITGLIIFEDVDYRDSSFSGFILIAIGILLLKVYIPESDVLENIVEQHSFKGRVGLREHNKQGHYIARRYYMETYGRLPNKQELREYTRKMHERKELHDLAKEYRHQKKSA